MDNSADITVEPAEPASARAYHALERMVVTLDLAPGLITTEGALIERLSLGRTPVREAIQRLSWEGLLEVRPRAGIAVAPLNAGDWLRVIDARCGVEILLARSAARYGARAAAVRFESAGATMRQAVERNDVLAFLAADKQLDEALAHAADNPFASRVAAPLQTHSRRFWFRYQANGGLAASADRHMALIDRILAGDEDGAAACAASLMALLRDHADKVARL